MHLSLGLRGGLRIRTLKVNVPHPSVVFGKEVLGEVIGKVFSSFLQVQVELFLIDAAAHPMETYVKILGALLAYVVIGDVIGGRDVGLDWGGRLWVANSNEFCAYGNSLLVVEENRSSLCLCGGIHDGADGLTFGDPTKRLTVSGPNVGRWRIVAYVVVARSATARFGMDKIRCVSINVEAHVASVEPDDCVRLCGCVVHEHLCLLDGFGGE